MRFLLALLCSRPCRTSFRPWPARMRWQGTWLLWLALLLATVPWPAAAQGVTVAIGGALQDDNDAVWARLVQLAGGPGARFAVLATAAGDPDRSAASISANLARHGGVAEHVRVAPRLPGIDIQAAVRDPRWLAVIERSQGVFFSGGAQSRLMDTLQPGGQPTPLLQAVRALWARGGVVAGTSSGAAVLSVVAFRDAPDPLAVLQAPQLRLRDGQEVDRGFGFLPAGVAVDQHFIRRGRIARLLPLMHTRRLRQGIGVEEDSAIVVRGDDVEVIGRAGALVVELPAAGPVASTGPFALAAARLNWLQPGDRYDLATHIVSPAAAKLAGTLLDRSNPAFSGYHEGPAQVNDILSEGTLVRTMARLVDSDQRTLTALAFRGQPEAAAGAETGPHVDVGFEWRFTVDAHTRGWHASGDAYTLVGVNLAIVPVRMARPLYTPWPGVPQAASAPAASVSVPSTPPR